MKTATTVDLRFPAELCGRSCTSAQHVVRALLVALSLMHGLSSATAADEPGRSGDRVIDADRLQQEQVPKPVARQLAMDTLSLDVTDTQVLISDSGRLVLAYNISSPPIPAGIDPIYRRSGFVHPIRTPAGRTLTAAFPFDHPHQQGLFSAWVRTTWNSREIDFWNLAGKTGTVQHQRLTATFASESGIGFEADLVHRSLAEPVVDILQEHWKLTVRPGQTSRFVFDLETTQSNLTDSPLDVLKYHYGGVAFRGPVTWLTDADGDLSQQSTTAGDVLPREPSEMQNDSGLDRLSGNGQHARWVALSGLLEGQPVSIAVLCHRKNFRAPQATRLHPTKPYFAFSPCVDGDFRIDREHPYAGKYRFVVTDARPDAASLNAEWQSWNEMPGEPTHPSSGN